MKKFLMSLSIISVSTFGMNMPSSSTPGPIHEKTLSAVKQNSPEKSPCPKKKKIPNNLSVLAEIASKTEYISTVNTPTYTSKKRSLSDLSDTDRSSNTKTRTFEELADIVGLFYKGKLNRNQEKSLVKDLTEYIQSINIAHIKMTQKCEALNEEIETLMEYQETYQFAHRRLNSNIETLTKEKESSSNLIRYLEKQVKNLKDENKILFADCKIQSKQMEIAEDYIRKITDIATNLREQNIELIYNNQNLTVLNEHLTRQLEKIAINGANLTQQNPNVENENFAGDNIKLINKKLTKNYRRRKLNIK